MFARVFHVSRPLLSLSRRRACPVLLCNGVGPYRPQGLEHHPSFREFSIRNPIGLHSRPAASLFGLRIGPFEGKAEPCAVAIEYVVIHDHADARPVLPHLGQLRRVSLACYRSATLLVVPDEIWADATGIRSYWPSCQTRSQRSNRSRMVFSSVIVEFRCACSVGAVGVQIVAKRIKQALRLTFYLG